MLPRRTSSFESVAWPVARRSVRRLSSALTIGTPTITVAPITVAPITVAPITVAPITVAAASIAAVAVAPGLFARRTIGTTIGGGG
ncbi:MAG: hypothetical protein EXS05_13820 [Planctomycetaceae bacterium]|nr:hypothetical protein [Planctomycetaceae bacterium]